MLEPYKGLVGWVVPCCSPVAIRAEVGGTLTAVHFRKGQDVRKGDLLFEIDPRPYQAALDQAEANLARDMALEANARDNAVREADLLKKGVATQNEYDTAKATADSLAASVQADKAAVETAQLQMEHCTIRSAIDGRAGDVLVDAGNIVKANDVALVTINQIQPIEVSFCATQEDLVAIQNYMAEGKLKVRVWPPQDEANVEIGELTFIDNAMDSNSGTMRVTATLENRRQRLWPGQYVNVALGLTTIEDAPVIPSEAIQDGRDSQYVYVIRDDNSVEARPVAVRMVYNDQAVIEKGLQPGEQVVTDGQFQLSPGAKVTIKPSVKSTSVPAGGSATVPAQTSAPAGPRGRVGESPRAEAAPGSSTRAVR